MDKYGSQNSPVVISEQYLCMRLDGQNLSETSLYIREYKNPTNLCAAAETSSDTLLILETLTAPEAPEEERSGVKGIVGMVGWTAFAPK